MKATIKVDWEDGTVTEWSADEVEVFPHNITGSTFETCSIRASYISGFKHQKKEQKFGPCELSEAQERLKNAVKGDE